MNFDKAIGSSLLNILTKNRISKVDKIAQKKVNQLIKGNVIKSINESEDVSTIVDTINNPNDVLELLERIDEIESNDPDVVNFVNFVKKTSNIENLSELLVNANPDKVSELISLSDEQNLINIVDDLNNPKKLTQLVNGTNTEKLSDLINDTDNNKLISIIDETITLKLTTIINDIDNTRDLKNSINKIIQVDDSIKIIDDIKDSKLVADVINIFTGKINALATVINETTNLNDPISITNILSSKTITTFLENNIDSYETNGELVTFILANLPN